MKTQIDWFFDRLHELEGRCGLCGKRECADKRKNSRLPSLIPLTSILDALDWSRRAERGSA